MVKVGVLIPDRNDRPQFLQHLFKMLDGQTMQGFQIELVNFKSTSNAPDLTKRVRLGFQKLKTDGCDCVLIMENDDYYAPNYIETMINKWLEVGKPELLGTDYTYCYHIFKGKYRLLKHPNRSSLMNTLINCKINPEWCEDIEVYLDLHLWKKHKGVAFSPLQPIAIGIKHGIGKCGGNGHFTMQMNNDESEILHFISQDSLKFYKGLICPNQ